jgi:hypothetical protein
MTPADAEFQETQRRFVEYLCRHLVCLVIRYVGLGPDGEDVGPVRSAFYPCFVAEFRGEWLLLTAGHNLEENTDQPVAQGRMRIVYSGLADYFGPDARVRQPTTFDYENTPRFYVDDGDLGLDVGVLHLRPYLRDHLMANGVAPITAENWLFQHRVECDLWAVLGFPALLVQEGADAAAVEAVLMPVRRLDALPEGVPAPVHDWFVGEVGDTTDIRLILGMSGGPVFGFRQGPGGEWRYWIVAMQSRMRRPERIVLGCPVPTFMALFERGYEAFVAGGGLEAPEGDNTDSQPPAGDMTEPPPGAGSVTGGAWR